MNITTIQDRLIEAADKELVARIEAAAQPMDHLLRNGCSYEIEVGASKVKVNWWEVLKALKDRAYAMHQEKARQEKSDAFIAKVGRLNDEMNELREMARPDDIPPHD